jgi:hypothetical protein
MSIVQALLLYIASPAVNFHANLSSNLSDLSHFCRIVGHIQQFVWKSCHLSPSLLTTNFKLSLFLSALPQMVFVELASCAFEGSMCCV